MIIIIDESSADQRIDRFLFKLFPRAPRGEIFRLFRKKDVKINGKRAQVESRINLGDEVSVYLSEEKKNTWMEPEKFPLGGEIHVLFEDEEDLVVFKKKGLKTTPDTPGEDCLATRVQAYLWAHRAPTFQPSPLGRLDKDTQGLVLFAKNYQRTKLLEELQRKGEIKKIYLALIFGTIKEGLCEIHLKKKENMPGVERDEMGKRARTFFRTLAVHAPYSLVEAELLSGRTHQIRASVAALGGRIMGDTLYGKGQGGQSLVCYKLEWTEKEVAYIPVEFLSELRKVGIDESDYHLNAD